MSDYYISKVSANDKRAHGLIDQLLSEEGIRRDGNLDYTCAMYDDDMNVIATGSCFGNTLRCLAVSSSHQGEGLMNEIVTHLIEFQCSRGNLHLFLYTKCNSAKFFSSLGFYEIARIKDNVVFMENRRNGFPDYLAKLQKETESSSATAVIEPPAKVAAIVMNANPFTLGHLYLVEKAGAENDLVHLFIVSEDSSLVPFAVRKKLIREGTAHLSNICYHDSGPYIISNATFPSYFQKDENAVIEGHARLDLTIFVQIAKALHINNRYVGEEPNSIVTGIYNQIMAEELPAHEIACTIVPRKESGDQVISASTVRTALKNQDLQTLQALVPESTYRYFCSDEAAPVVARIQAEENVVHY
ncbi:MAG: [citrate (pro-3S)-lyase] ligase [Lachnospiraceae bacterium]|nr:[citrate (pro-3S)-lyase] ligase [Lachnospiraceae bacterium]